MKVVIAAHTPIGAPLVVGSHHLAIEITKLGHQVDHIPLPFAPWELLRSGYMSFAKLSARTFFPKKIGEGLTQLSFLSLVPKRTFNFLMFKYYLSLYSRLSFSLRRSTECDVLIIDHPYQAFIIRKFKAKLIIYRPTDIYYSKASHMPNIAKLEEYILCKCDAIVSTSQVTIDHLKSTYPVHCFIRKHQTKPTTVITNGVSLEDFEVSADIEKFNTPTAVYMGSIDFRFDIEMCNKLAIANPNVNFLIIGPINQALLDKFAAPNITLMGAVEYQKLSQTLSKCHVGLLLANQHVFNSSRSPMKLYEYACAGLPVVSSYIEEVARRNEQFVIMYDSFETADLALSKAFNNQKELSALAKVTAKNHAWANKTKQLIDFCSDML